jgi:ubiquinone/menaquinone biosynthesis C-methylase UbiE
MKLKATESYGRHRVRATYGAHFSTPAVYLTDAKRVDPPAPSEPKPTPVIETLPPEPRTPSPPISFRQAMEEVRKEDDEALAKLADFDAMKQTLKTGVQVAVVPQLFETSTELSIRMVKEAKIQPGERVLEPSVGTGKILRAIRGLAPQAICTAVEINPRLCSQLRAVDHGTMFVEADFLECTTDKIGSFDAVIMNPPFHAGADIKHIHHARLLLKPGGRLVALCANGPRQQAELRPLATTWEELPDGTFAEQGTAARVVLMTVKR